MKAYSSCIWKLEKLTHIMRLLHALQAVTFEHRAGSETPRIKSVWAFRDRQDYKPGVFEEVAGMTPDVTAAAPLATSGNTSSAAETSPAAGSLDLQLGIDTLLSSLPLRWPQPDSSANRKDKHQGPEDGK